MLKLKQASDLEDHARLYTTADSPGGQTVFTSFGLENCLEASGNWGGV